MDLDLVFLGTSASMPTAMRAPAAFLLRRGGERLLFDCAEGTQRQLQRSTVGLPDLEEIFLTHFHGDHFLGLPGMLKTFALRGRDGVPLTVYGPSGLKELFRQLKPFLGRLPYPLTTVELEAGEELERGEYRIETFALDHGGRCPRLRARRARAAGALRRRGRRRARRAARAGARDAPGRRAGDARRRAGDHARRGARPARGRAGRSCSQRDTAPSPVVAQAAHKADLLVHEATFGAAEAERARETLHSTAAEAAEVAKRAEVRLLALTHLSTRYFGSELAEEARARLRGHGRARATST